MIFPSTFLTRDQDNHRSFNVGWLISHMSWTNWILMRDLFHSLLCLVCIAMTPLSQYCIQIVVSCIWAPNFLMNILRFLDQLSFFPPGKTFENYKSLSSHYSHPLHPKQKKALARATKTLASGWGNACHKQDVSLPWRLILVLLMEEIPNNHLGCIKPVVNNGISTTNLNWWFPDFWTINSSSGGSLLSGGPLAVKGRGP